MIIHLVSEIKKNSNVSQKINDDINFIAISDNEFYWYLDSMRNMNIDDYEITQDSYFEMVEEIDINLVQCPYCEHIGVLEHTEMTYERSVINTVEELDNPLNIELVVVYCQNCNTYHAIIPWGFIPFTSFTYRFVLEALYSYYFKNDENKKRTAEEMCIARSTLHNWIKRFESEAGSVASLHDMKKRISDVFNETANALSGTDPDQIRRQLLERLAKYRAFLSAFLGCKLAAEDKPFLIPARTKADKIICMSKSSHLESRSPLCKNNIDI